MKFKFIIFCLLPILEKCVCHVPIFIWSSNKNFELPQSFAGHSFDPIELKKIMMKQLHDDVTIVLINQNKLRIEDILSQNYLFASSNQSFQFKNLKKLMKSRQAVYTFTKNDFCEYFDMNALNVFGSANDQLNLQHGHLNIFNLSIGINENINDSQYYIIYDQMLLNFNKQLHSEYSNYLVIYTQCNEESRVRRSVLQNYTTYDISMIIGKILITIDNKTDNIKAYIYREYQQCDDEGPNITCGYFFIFKYNDLKSFTNIEKLLDSSIPSEDIFIRIMFVIINSNHWIIDDVTLNFGKSREYLLISYDKHYLDQVFNENECTKFKPKYIRERVSLQFCRYSVIVSPNVTNTKIAKMREYQKLRGMWHFLIVAPILIIILSFALSMLINLQANDLTDNPNQKPIVINEE